jgi:hypothetical protein
MANAGSTARGVILEAVKRKHSVIAIESAQLLQPNPPLQRRPAAGYTYGYNRTNLAKDVRAIALAIDQICSEEEPSELWIVALEQTTPIAAVAVAATHSETPCAKLLCTPADFSKLSTFDDPRFLPGASLLGDIQGIIQIIEPKDTRLWSLGESPSIEELFPHDS